MNWFSHRLAQRLPFFYGYLMLPVAMLMQIGTSPGQTFAVSAFTPALLESLQLSESRLALAYMLGTLVAAVPLSAVGPFADRFGLRVASFIVVLGLSATCYAASWVNGFAGLLCVFFLLRFLGQGSLTLLSGNTTSMWFRHRIGRVSALMSIGTAAAFAWVPGILADSIAEIGWRSTYQWLAVWLLVVLVPLILLVFRNRPEDLGQHVDGLLAGENTPIASGDSSVETTGETMVTLHEAMRYKTFYVLTMTNAVWAMVGTGLVFYLFTLCGDRGFDASLPPALFKTFGLSMLALQFLGSVLADFVKLNRLFGFGASLLVLGLVAALYGQSEIAMHLFACMFGAGQGMLIASGSVIWVRYYGRKHLGSIRGTVWCATVAGSGIGPLMMGQFKDWTGTYDAAIAVFLCLILPLAVAAWWIHPPKVTALQTINH